MSEELGTGEVGSNASNASTTSCDGDVVSTILRRTLDKNKYATKKTISQGILNVALLSANAAQLKYVLEMGEKHEFYILMLCLLTISIGLQIIQAILCIILGTSLDINDENDHDNANKTNNIVLCVNVVLVAVNVLISSFDMKNDTSKT